MLHCIIPCEYEAVFRVGNGFNVCRPCDEPFLLVCRAARRRQKRYSLGCGSALILPAAPQLRSTTVNLPVAHTTPPSATRTWRRWGSHKTSCFGALLGSGSTKALFGVGLWDISHAPTQSSAFNFPDLLAWASCTFRDGVLSSVFVKGEYPSFRPPFADWQPGQNPWLWKVERWVGCRAKLWK